MIIAIYVRVSTLEQAKHGYSIAQQLNDLKHYCKAKHYDIYNIYSDKGFSATKINRPAYKQMMSDIKQWDSILIYKLDRIHRNRLNFSKMINTLKKQDRQLISLNESIDMTTATGELLMNIINDVATWESGQIGERAYNGKLQKAKEGKGFNGGTTPYGYEYKGNDRFIINNKEASIVKRIYKYFSLYGYLDSVTEQINKEGIRTRENKRFNRAGIRYILSNPVYCGFLRYEGYVYKNGHKALVDIRKFNNIQRILGNKKNMIKARNG